MVSFLKFYREKNLKRVEADGFNFEIPEDWEVVKFGDICKFMRGFSYRSNQITKRMTNIRFITLNDFEKEGGIKGDVERLYLKENVKVDSSFFLTEGDVLIANTDMSKGFIIGAPILIENLDENIVYSMDLTKLIFDKNKINSRFLFYLLTYKPVRQKMKTFAQGTNVLHLNHDLSKNIRIPLPPFEEQRKIAHVLISIDKAIEAVDEAIAKAERIKKGLMQKLLTRGIGHTEFKEVKLSFIKYRIPRKWIIKTLPEVSIIKGRIGWHGLKDEDYLKEGDYYLVRGIDFENGKVSWDKCVYISKEWYEKDPNIQLKEGDILITKDGSIGKIALVDKLPKKATLGTGVFLIRQKNNDYIPQYLFYILQSEFFDSFIKFIKAGSTLSHLYQKDLAKFELPLPPLSEQQKIAEILSKWDKVIEIKKAKKEKLERMKKKVMELLLTGKLRVK